MCSKATRKIESVFSGFNKFVGKPASSDDCKKCQLASIMLRNSLKAKSFQQELELDIEHDCKIFGPYAKECEDLVKKWWSGLLKDLEEALKDPKALCTELGFCPSATPAGKGFKLQPALTGLLEIIAKERGPSLKGAEQNCVDFHMCSAENSIPKCLALFYAKRFVNKVEKMPGSSDDCKECQLLMVMLRKGLKDKSFQQQLEQEIEYDCKIFGKDAKECEDLVKKWWSALLKEIDEVLQDPWTVCVQLGVCPGATLAGKKGLKLQPALAGLDSVILGTFHAKKSVKTLGKMPTVADTRDEQKVSEITNALEHQKTYAKKKGD